MTTPLTIYIVRHGQTEFNIQDMVQGFADSPLTAQGREQASKLGQGLKDVPFKAAFASDLGRQRDTARLILAENVAPPPELAEVYNLREWNCGSFEAKPMAEMWKVIFRKNGLASEEQQKEFKQSIKTLGYEGITRAISECDPEGTTETYEEIMSRAQSALRKIINDTLAAGGGNALVVTSGWLVRGILQLMAPEEYKHRLIGNCSVTILHYDNGAYTLESVGDMSYVQ